MIAERRTQRSEDIENALALWFRSVAKRCGTEVVALATAKGDSVVTSSVVSAVQRAAASETALVEVPTFCHRHQRLVLWARGARGTARVALNEAEAGLFRILDGHF
jgi:hypothetical protein